MSTLKDSVSVTAPGKINLALYVGSPDLSGFHPLLTAFQAVDLGDTVNVRPAESMSLQCVADFDTSGVPLDHSNIAWRAHTVLSEHSGHGNPVHIEIHKQIPVAGGMAGGSADGAATLIALNELWDAGCQSESLFDLARKLGSDVPFSLIGGAAIGTGRGDVLQPLTVDAPLHMVLVTSRQHLSTPEVYTTLDALRGEESVKVPDQLGDEFVRAWKSGDAVALAGLMHNDLEQSALVLEPSLRGVLDQVTAAGALRSMVSGSGPTVIGLADSRSHAEEIAETLKTEGFSVVVTRSTTRGTLLQPPVSDQGS